MLAIAFIGSALTAMVPAITLGVNNGLTLLGVIALVFFGYHILAGNRG